MLEIHRSKMRTGVKRVTQHADRKSMDNKLYKMMDWPKIEEIIYSECDNPHELLGPHPVGGQTLIQAYFPMARAITIRFEDKLEDVEMELADDDGFFAVLLPYDKLPNYHYLVIGSDDSKSVCGEPYRFAPLITREDTE